MREPEAGNQRADRRGGRRVRHLGERFCPCQSSARAIVCLSSFDCGGCRYGHRAACSRYLRCPSAAVAGPIGRGGGRAWAVCSIGSVSFGWSCLSTRSLLLPGCIRVMRHGRSLLCLHRARKHQVGVRSQQPHALSLSAIGLGLSRCRLWIRPAAEGLIRQNFAAITARNLHANQSLPSNQLGFCQRCAPAHCGSLRTMS